jgi:thiol-disulfide isomerase/thioredoxin
MWIVLAVLGVIWVAFFQFVRSRDGGSGRPSLHTPAGRFEAAFDWPLKARDGRDAALADFRGKAIFLNIWATWCPPCVAELPAIERLAANPKLKDVAFLAVSTEDLATIQGFARSRDLKVPVYAADPEGVPPIFVTDAIPATFLIAPDGRIATAQLGAAEWDDPAVVDYLARLTSESAAGTRAGP